MYISTICTIQLMKSEKQQKVLQDNDATFCGMRNEGKISSPDKFKDLKPWTDKMGMQIEC